jgi:gluconokinase
VCEVEKSELISLGISAVKILTGINRDVAEKMGIQQELPLVVGAADGQLANLGIGDSPR